MTIDEAIKELNNDLKLGNHGGDTPIVKAMKLGIEALRREKLRRGGHSRDLPPLMPGETEE